MATYPVKYLHSQMRGAPALSAAAGTLLAVLDACLDTGFGMVSVSSISVTSGVATATVAPGDGFEAGAIIIVAGATPSALNGEARVLSTGSTSFTFATTAADGAASGTITAKYAPVHSWSKTYTGTNKAVWKSVDAQANGHSLRIDDSNTSYARVTGYESMSDVDTGTGAFPSSAQLSGGGFWHKVFGGLAGNVRWWLAGDSRLFYLMIALGSYGANVNALATGAHFFGDPLPRAPGGDVWSTCLTFCGSNNPNPNLNIGTPANKSSPTFSTGAACCPRAVAGIGSSQIVQFMPISPAASSDSSVQSGFDDSMSTFPSAIDGALPLVRSYMREGQGVRNPPRADVPGFFWAPVSGVNTYINAADVLPGTGDLAGRRLIAMGTSNSVNTVKPSLGVFFIDATGPWR